MRGFNVGVTISLGDMETAIDYLNNPEVFMPDIENIIKSKTEKAEDSFKLAEAPAEALMSDDATAHLDEDNDIEVVEEIYADEEETGEDEIEIEMDEEYFEEDDEENEDTEEEINDETVEEIDTETDEEISIEEDEEYFESSEDEYVDGYENTEYVPEVTIKPYVSTEEDIKKEQAKSERELELERKLQEVMSKLNQANQTKPVQPVGQARPVRPVVQNNTQEHKAVHVAQPEDKPKKPINNVRQLPVRNNTYTNADNKQARIEAYSNMDIDALYKEVKKFMATKNIKQNTLDRSILEGEFGAVNIKKLILKSYLISIGKGLTVGK